MMNLMAPNFTEMHLSEGLFSGPCLHCPKDSSSLAGEGDHGGCDNRIFCTGIHHESHRLALYLDSDRGLVGAEGKGAQSFSI
jgi:hypothetical protein